MIHTQLPIYKPTQAEAPSEREAFETWVFDCERTQPMTWDKECAKFGQETPEHKRGMYYFNWHQRMWEAWQARAALASQPQAEAVPVAWALSGTRGVIFSSAYPMCASEAQAEEMKRRHLGQSTHVVPLYLHPPTQASQPQAVDAEDAARLDWIRNWPSGTIRLDDAKGLVPTYINWRDKSEFDAAIDAARRAGGEG